MDHLISDFFSADHLRLDTLFHFYQSHQQDDPVLAREFFQKFKQGLLKHIDWEENLLFPRFEDVSGMNNMGPTQVMRHEHSMIKALLKIIENKLETEQDPSQDNQELMDLLLQHNHKEERILYVRCDQMLKQSSVEQILLGLS